MVKRRSIKEIANNMQKDIENAFQNLVRNHIAGKIFCSKITNYLIKSLYFRNCQQWFG